MNELVKETPSPTTVDFKDLRFSYFSEGGYTYINLSPDLDLKLSFLTTSVSLPHPEGNLKDLPSSRVELDKVFKMLFPESTVIPLGFFLKS